MYFLVLAEVLDVALHICSCQWLWRMMGHGEYLEAKRCVHGHTQHTEQRFQPGVREANEGHAPF